MQRWQTVLVAVMILWLPLQGYAALAMPFCRHGLHASASEHAPAQARGETHRGDTGRHHVVHVALHHHGTVDSLACNDCGVCHLASSPTAPTSASTIQALCANYFAQFSPTLPPLFVPEQHTPPPLAAIA